MTVTLQAIEDAIVARIRAASAADALGYTIRTVDTYGAELDDELTKVVRQFPAVWVVFAGGRDLARGGDTFETELTWTVVVAARSLRGEGARRRGAGGEPGAYDLLQDVRALLAGNAVGLDIRPLAPGRIGVIANARKLQAAIYAIDFVTVADLAGGTPPAALDDFTDFQGSWDLAPAPDDVIEAEDSVVLPAADEE